MNNIERARALKADCQEFTQRFYQDLDNHEYGRLSEAFAADGVWLRQGKQLQGPQAVLAELEKRPPTMVTRHVISNQTVDIIDEHNMRSQYYITLYYSDTGEAPENPVKFSGPTCLFTYYDELQLIGTDWRIVRKWSRKDFSVP
jgi:hypothetical protein